jgi:4-amino-4-deoxy-L-arabinose transferase-like glycosyltransferase
MTQWIKGYRAYVIIGFLAAMSAMAGIFTLPPLDRDESRFAQATAQMLETGDFVRINFLDEARNKKPVGIHWLQVAAVSVLSDVDARQIWAYRIPSMLGAILAALACFWGGCRLVGREAAFAGAALLSVTVLLGIEGGIAKTDAMLVGCTTLAMAALANLRSGGGKKTALLFWLAIGLGALIKGPVTPMVAGLTIIALVVWERRANWLKPLLFWPGPVLAIALVLPWLISIQIATEGGFLREALGDDLGPKLVSGHERHGGPVGYHLLLLPLLLFPATLFLIPGFARLIAALRSGGTLGGLEGGIGGVQGASSNDPAATARFLLAWAIPTWLVFEILPTKLPHYVLPAYPALALIAGWGLIELARAANWQRWISWGLFAFAGLVFAVLLPVAFVIYGDNSSWDAINLSQAGFEGGFELGLDPTIAAWVFAATALFIGLTAASLVAERTRNLTLVLALSICAGLGWQIAARGAALPNAYAVRLADQVRGAREYSQTIAGISPDEIVTASSYTEPSLVFSLGSDTVLGAAEEVLAFAESREEATMVVLDLSRDPGLRAALFNQHDAIPEDWWGSVDVVTEEQERIDYWRSIRPDWELADLPTDPEQLATLRSVHAADSWWRIVYELQTCHRTLASGTNYSRGDETTLLILFTRCASEDDAVRVMIRLSSSQAENSSTDPEIYSDEAETDQ